MSTLKKLFVAASAAVVSFALLASTSDYSRYVDFTVSSDAIQTEGAAVVLVRLSEGSPVGFDYADIQTADGSDILCTSVDGETVYPCEVDTWDPNGESLLWVRLPNAQQGAAFRLWYGNSAGADDNVPSATWTDYSGVWHLGTLTPDTSVANAQGTYANSTAATGIDGHLSTYGVPNETGVLGKCFRVNDSTAFKGGNYMKGGVWVNDAGADSPIDGGTQFTISGWFKHGDFGYYYDHVFHKRQKTNNGSGSPKDAFAIESNSGSGTTPNLGPRGSGSTSSSVALPSNLVDVWGYLTFVYDGAKCFVYENGVLVTSSGIKIDACKDNDGPLVFGDNTDVTAGSGDAAWNGWIDEVRFSKGAKSADFIAAEYAAMTTADLLTAGAAQYNEIQGDTLLVTGRPGAYGTPNPAYGKTENLAAGKVHCVAPADWVEEEDGRTRHKVTGWTLVSLNAARTETRNTSGTGAVCEYNHVAGEFDQLVWKWELVEYKLTVVNAGAGSVDVPTGWYAPGAAVTLTATADDGASFKGWTGDVVSEDATIALVMDAPKSVRAGFKDSGFGVRYIKPETCGRGDGTCWADAMTLRDYLADCDPTAIVELRLSAGVHEVCNPSGLVKEFTSGASMTLRGGYAGTEGADEPPTLPRTATIISGDGGRNDIWAHYDPETDTTDYEFDGEKIPVLDYETGAFNDPPAPTGKFDAYYPVQLKNGVVSEDLSSDNSKQFLQFSGTGAVVIENLTFTGFGQGTKGSGGSIVYITKNAANVGQTLAVTNVLFRGCANASMLLRRYNGKSSAPVRLVDCAVQSCRIEDSGLYHSDKDQIVAENLTVSGIVAKNAGTVSALVLSTEKGGDALTVTGATIERVIGIKNSQPYSSYNYSSQLFGTYNSAMTMNDVTIRNCYFDLSNAACASRDYANYAALMNTGAGFVADGLRIENNRVGYTAVNPAEVRYSAFLRCGQSSNNVISDSSFTSNEIVYATAVATESYVAPIALTGRMVLGNVSFFDNAVTATATGDACAEPVVSRALLERNNAANSTANWLFVRYCTFGGATAGDDIVHAGDYENPRPSYVIDSILWSDAPGTDYRGVTADRLGGVRVMNSIVRNSDAAHPTVEYVDVHEDDPVLVWDAATGFAKPTVRVPGVSNGGSLYDCGNVAHYAASDDLPDHQGTYPWAYLAWGWCKDAARHPAPDALGAERPLGAGTLGAVQVTFGDDPVVVARVRPTSGGTVKGSSQTVVGGVAGAMTAVPEDGFSFLGWYDAPTGGTQLSPDAVYTPEATTDTAVYARFGAGAVQWTFDLGECGTFDGSGEPTATVEAFPGDPAPTVPAFTLNPEWHFTGWTPEIPAVVETGDKAFSVAAIPSCVTVFFDTHATSGDGSGRDWANAARNLADAYVAAAAGYEAEIRVKQGVHVPTLTAEGHPVNSVRIVGGWTGEGETRTDDPRATVFSGDLNGDDVWMGPDGESRGTVLADGAFTPVNSAKADAYWRPGNYSENVTRLFNLESLSTTANLTLEGITFTGYGRNTGAARGAVVYSGGYSVVTVTNCDFIANNAYQSGDMSGILSFNTAALVTDCRFLGNYGSAVRTYQINALFWADGQKAVIDGCEFDRGCLIGGAGLVAQEYNGYGDIRIRRSKVHDCYAENCSGNIFLNSVSSGMFDCRFSDNVCTNAYGSYTSDSNQSSPSFGYVDAMTNCVFENNRMYVDPAKADVTRFPTTFGAYGSSMLARDCSFTGNRVIGGLHPVSALSLNQPGALNCAFTGNESVSAAADGWTCTLLMMGHSGVANCTFSDNGTPTAEIAFARTWEASQLTISNVLGWGPSEDYLLFTNATAKNIGLTIRYTTARNLDNAGVGNSADDPGISDKLFCDAASGHHYRLTAGRAKSARNGCQLYHYGASSFVIPNGNGGWTRWDYAAENVKKENVGEPLEADLLGNPYKPNIILRGAVQDRITAGMAIIVR